MEPWEIELDFLTWDAHERAIAKENGGEFHNVEEFETSEEDFKRMAEELNQQATKTFDPNEWEEVK